MGQSPQRKILKTMENPTESIHIQKKNAGSTIIYATVQSNKKRRAAMDKTTSKRKNKTEAFHAFFQAIIPTILEIWTDRCIDRNKPNMTHYPGK